ncbi:hypothetical protein LOK49_LG12G02717 [Camellia lanceoleosa]|uniref:Uncharacterized protein n=1 Tax=Camellia lanceoleosa TaxID=1840588 RepID=A0ACC0FRR0_9ERIC|nr:hypothetical protein LOK49_LG12G02717 [Camellia lanceoleosa]
MALYILRDVRVLEVQVLEAKTINQCCSCLNHLEKVKELSAEEKDEDHGSNRVGKSLQHLGVESTQPRAGGAAQGSEHFKNEASRELTRGNGSIIEAKWKSDTEVAESSSIVGKKLEVEACKEMVAGSSAFNAPKPAEQGNDGNVFSPGCMRRVSGSSLNSQGLNSGEDLGQQSLNQVDSAHNNLNHGLCGPTDVREADLSEYVSPIEEVDSSAEESSSSEDEDVVGQHVVAAGAKNIKTKGKELSRPRPEKEVDINDGPQGRFWKSNRRPRALFSNSQQCCEQVYTPGYMRSLSESSMLKPGLNLEVVLGCNMGFTNQVIHTEVGPSAQLNKGQHKAVNGRKEGQHNRNCKGKDFATDELGEQQRVSTNHGEKAQPNAPVEVSNGRDKGCGLSPHPWVGSGGMVACDVLRSVGWDISSDAFSLYGAILGGCLLGWIGCTDAKDGLLVLPMFLDKN